MSLAALHGTCHGKISVSKTLHTLKETELKCCRQVQNYYRQMELPHQRQLHVKSLEEFPEFKQTLVRINTIPVLYSYDAKCRVFNVASAFLVSGH